MNLLPRSTVKQCRLALMLAGGLFVAAPAWAQANYNLLLKPQGSTTPVACAIGAVSFNKAGTGTFPAAFSFMNLVQSGCVGGMPSAAYTGTLNVIVENVTINGQSQGPNVVGLSGTLTQTPGTATMTFSYTPGSASTANPVRTVAFSGGPQGSYHVYRSNGVGVGAQALPEPGALWLVLPALAGLVLARRRRRPRAD